MSIGPTGVSQVSIGFRMEPDLFGHNSQGPKNIKNPRFSGFCGRHRMLSDVIGQMVVPGTNQKSPEPVDSTMLSEI